MQHCVAPSLCCCAAKDAPAQGIQPESRHTGWRPALDSSCAAAAQATATNAVSKQQLALHATLPLNVQFPSSTALRVLLFLSLPHHGTYPPLCAARERCTCT